MSTLIFLQPDENLTVQNNNNNRYIIYIQYAAYNKPHYKNLSLQQYTAAIYIVYTVHIVYTVYYIVHNIVYV